MNIYNMFRRIIVLVLDGFGVGELPDADTFGDKGADTLGNLSRKFSHFSLPNLEKLGLGKLSSYPFSDEESIIGSYGKMNEKNPAKNSDAGHWEMMGLILDEAFPVYPFGFPEDMLNTFKKQSGFDIIGNEAASGTEIIGRLGEEHIKTEKLIIYTSADSVFQIAAHIDVVSPEKLYDICMTARNLFMKRWKVARVIARPFTGVPGEFLRLNNLRKDFQFPPPKDTLLNLMKKQKLDVIGFGEVGSLFCGQGFTEQKHTPDNKKSIDYLMKHLKKTDWKGLIFGNLVDFDMLYGHRRYPEGYYEALKRFDDKVPMILSTLRKDDLLIITGDHGNDPTFKGTDHTREYVPLLCYGNGVKIINLGIRDTYADVAKTIAENFDIPLDIGTSFLNDLR